MIVGATNAIYISLDTGTYYVEITDSLGCVRNSDTLYIDITGIFEDYLGFELNLFPNPSDGEFVLMLDNNIIRSVQIHLVDTKGRLVYSKDTFNTGEGKVILPYISPGVYFLRLTHERGVIVKKIIQL